MFAVLFSCSKKMKGKKSKSKTRNKMYNFQISKRIKKTQSNIGQKRRKTGKKKGIWKVLKT